MILTIETNDVKHVWRTGDDLAELRHAITVLNKYATELEQPATIAQLAQQPIEPS